MRATASSAGSGKSAGAELTRLSVTVTVADADVARGVLSEIAPTGWEERDDHEHVGFDWWVTTAEADPVRVAAAMSAAGIAAGVAEQAEDDAWKDGLRRHHQPVEIGGRVRIRPPWEDATGGLIDVVIDPAMAFGTGQHATTRGCIALLIDAPGGSLLDVGCGSGILAITAAKLGYGPVTAIDNDPIAVEATIANAAINGVAVAASLGDSDRDVLPPAGTLVANILAIPVTALAAIVADPPPARVVLSGFRPHDSLGVVAAWTERGYRLDRQIDADHWTAVRLVRS